MLLGTYVGSGEGEPILVGCAEVAVIVGCIVSPVLEGCKVGGRLGDRVGREGFTVGIALEGFAVEEGLKVGSRLGFPVEG